MQKMDNVPLHVLKHFKKEALKHPQFLSLADYDMIYNPKGVLQKISNRFRFTLKVLTQF
jgi:hypothetical protein